MLRAAHFAATPLPIRKCQAAEQRAEQSHFLLAWERCRCRGCAFVKRSRSGGTWLDSCQLLFERRNNGTAVFEFSIDF